MTSLSKPHDAFFKQTFSQFKFAQNFLQEYLPPQVLAALDLNHLELQKDSFVDPQLQEQFSDLLYRCPLTGEEDTLAYIYLLLEHKSSRDKLTPLQLLGYMVQIWQQKTRQGEKTLPIILPLVVYHGRGRWRIAEDFGELFTGPEALRPYWPAFRYELYDLGSYSDEDIRGMVENQISLLVFKHIFNPHLPEKLPDIFRQFLRLKNVKTAVELLDVVLRYISVATDNVTQEEIQAALEAALGEQGDEIMPTIAERWIEQGKEQGLKEGLHLGKQEGLQQGLRQGVEVGQQQALRNSILDLLQVRFDAAPVTVAGRLSEITDLEILRHLLRRAATAETVTAFEEALDTLNES